MIRWFYFLGIFFSLASCQTQTSQITDADRNAILHIHKNYTEGWKNADEAGIMSLFEEDAMIQPNSLQPISGKKNIQIFWFPKDNSITTVNTYHTHLLAMEKVENFIAATHQTFLDWDYQKGTHQFGMIQKGISTTLYRKQEDESWKIWRKMWTDYQVVNK